MSPGGVTRRIIDTSPSSSLLGKMLPYPLPHIGFYMRGFSAESLLTANRGCLRLLRGLRAIVVAIVDPSAAINAVERGASLKIIGGTVPIAAYTLVGCPKFKTIKELKGTTIGVVSLVSGSTIFLKEMLKKEGLELNRDYSILQGGPTTQRLASLKACNTSATMILGGDLPRARELGFTEIARLHDYVPDLQFHTRKLHLTGRNNKTDYL